MQLVHPPYFMHFGYEDNFWERDSIHEDVLIRTQMGLLKEGDSFSIDSIIVTPTSDFLEKTEYLVETDTIAVPYTLGYLNGGSVVCYQDDSVVENFSECPRDSLRGPPSSRVSWACKKICVEEKAERCVSGIEARAGERPDGERVCSCVG